MLETVNISLPRPLSTKMDEVVEKEGYASRSEFFRTLLRFYLQLNKATTPKRFVLSSFVKRPLTEVEKGLLFAGKYSPRFVKSVMAGLRKSSLYKNEN